MTTRAPDMPGTMAPEWLAHRYDPTHDAVHFVRAERALRRSVPFLLDEHLPSASEPLVLRREEALALAPPPAPIHFIFHSAFCCSTLLVGALDREGVASGLSEPVILNDLVGWRHRGADRAAMAARLDDALNLLARPFGAGEAVIVKPSNVVNGLAAVMLGMRPQAHAVLLHAPLRQFLTSVAKKGLDGRMWVRTLFMTLRTEGLVQRIGFSDQDFFGQTDLQIAAIGWLSQHALFLDLERAPATAGRVMRIGSDALLASPEDVLTRIGRDFELALDEARIAEIVAGPFRRNSKSGVAFDRSDRDAEYRAAGAAHGDEIDKVVIWAEAVANAAGIPLGSATG